MLRFFITPQERTRAHKRAVELDLRRSDPPSTFPFVWTDQLGAVHRWFTYSPAEDKVGTVYFVPDTKEDHLLLGAVECSTEMSYYPLGIKRSARAIPITDLGEHKKLIACFFRELLTDKLN